MTRYLGGLITKDESLVIPSDNFEDTSAPGVWTLEEAQALNKQGLWPTAGNANPVKFVENIFSIDTYVGSGSSRTITTGIDLVNNSGLVWIKNRTSAESHFLCDTVRGAPNHLFSDTTAGQASFNNSLGAFTSTGFTLAGAADVVNSAGNNKDYVAWTWRKAPKFFDVVQYSGTGSEQSIAHNLGQVPGMIIHKRTDTNEDWRVYHRGANNGSSPEDYIIGLNGDDDFSNDNTNFGAPSSTHFTVKTSSGTNNGSGTYIAYLFGHDTSSDGMVQCGYYTGNGSSSGPTVTLGFEPQWVLVKRSSGGNAEWILVDEIRGNSEGAYNAGYFVSPNLTNAETGGGGRIKFTSTGFRIGDTGSTVNASGSNYIYVAIRRAPMATPTARSDVFHVELKTAGGTQTFDTGFPVDMLMNPVVANTGSSSSPDNVPITSRLQGPREGVGVYLRSQDDSVEQAGSGFGWNLNFANKYIMKDVYSGSQNHVGYAWRRAPGYFDVVAYTGTGSVRTIDHNLTVAPEMMWIKRRNTQRDWSVYHSTLGATKYIKLNSNSTPITVATWWNDTAPTSSVFTIGASVGVNGGNDTYIAFLFATLAGISKVGGFSHTNGSSTDVDCGFSSGASLVIAKRYDSTGNWYLWDSARGIVSGNDPYQLMDTSDHPHTTNTDYIDPLNSGFQITSSFTTGDYIFYAIAQ